MRAATERKDPKDRERVEAVLGVLKKQAPLTVKQVRVWSHLFSVWRWLALRQIFLLVHHNYIVSFVLIHGTCMKILRLVFVWVDNGGRRSSAAMRVWNASWELKGTAWRRRPSISERFFLGGRALELVALIATFPHSWFLSIDAKRKSFYALISGLIFFFLCFSLAKVIRNNFWKRRNKWLLTLSRSNPLDFFLRAVLGVLEPASSVFFLCCFASRSNHRFLVRKPNRSPDSRWVLCGAGRWDGVCGRSWRRGQASHGTFCSNYLLCAPIAAPLFFYHTDPSYRSSASSKTIWNFVPRSRKIDHTCVFTSLFAYFFQSPFDLSCGSNAFSFLRLLVFTLEVAVSSMARNVDQFVLLFDASKLSNPANFTLLFSMTS